MVALPMFLAVIMLLLMVATSLLVDDQFISSKLIFWSVNILSLYISLTFKFKPILSNLKYVTCFLLSKTVTLHSTSLSKTLALIVAFPTFKAFILPLSTVTTFSSELLQVTFSSLK